MKQLLFFTAEWCGDCYPVKTFMPKIEEKYQKEIEIITVDIDQMMGLAQKYEILGIPSFVILDEKKEILDTFISKNFKTQEEIEAFINKNIK